LERGWKLATTRGFARQGRHLMQYSRIDWLIIVLVFGLSVAANLPGDLHTVFPLAPIVLQLLLLLLLVFALVRYATLSMVIAINILFVGSGVSALLAEHFQVDHRGLLTLAGLMLVLALGRHILKLADMDATPDSAAAQSVQTLFRAVEQGNLAWTHRLLAMGADINVRDEAGRTPLMYAAAKGYDDMVQVLIQNGADPGLQNNRGESAMTIALMKGYKRIAESLRLADESTRPEQRRPERGRT
jgi:hypothetical protein